MSNGNDAREKFEQEAQALRAECLSRKLERSLGLAPEQDWRAIVAPFAPQTVRNPYRRSRRHLLEQLSGLVVAIADDPAKMDAALEELVLLGKWAEHQLELKELMGE